MGRARKYVYQPSPAMAEADRFAALVERRVVAILRLGSLTPAALKAELGRLWGAKSVSVMGHATTGDKVDWHFFTWAPSEKPEMTYCVAGEGLLVTPEQYAYHVEACARLGAKVRSEMAERDRTLREELSQPRRKRKNRHAVALGKLGGAKGGKARAEKLSREERSAIAREAAIKRWAREKTKQAGQEPVKEQRT